MDPSPQWNFFQPPVSEPSSLLDYNRTCNTLPHSNFPSNESVSRNNGFQNYTNNSWTQSSNKTPSTPSSSFHNYTNNTWTPSSNKTSTTTSSSFYNYTNNSWTPISNKNPSIPSSSTGKCYPYMNNEQSSQQSFGSTSNSQSRQLSYQSNNFYSSTGTGSNSSLQYNEPISDFKIGTFTLNSNGCPSESSSHETSNSNISGSSNSYSANNSSAANQSCRETGIIEKLLQTYGFIQCCERQARLFFHFSQFDGNTEHLRIGDPVEFEVTFDRRTGKPIASSVTKISPEVVLSEERVIGIVTTELKSENGGEQQGRITYENRGECFFLPYSKEDVEGYVVLKPGDTVSFQIATNQRKNGNLASRHVRLENPAEPVKYQGVVCAIKDSYGFIERADVVDEIFFHFSEAKTIPEGLKLGDDVEFLIQSHNSKEVATNMVKLPSGTVVFEDVNLEEIRGQVLKPVEKTLRQNQKDPLTGRIRYRGKDRSEVEVKFGERDQKADFTLRHGDWVQFHIATDRRDNLQKATEISLLDESFKVSGEKREEGVIHSLKECFGYIKCADRDARMYFLFNELLDPDWKISAGEEVEFTVVSDSTAPVALRQSATRIRKLAAGTVKFEILIQENLEGEVTLEPNSIPQSPNFDTADRTIQPGIISFYIDAVKQTINFYPTESIATPRLGDTVQFSMFFVKSTKERVAMSIKILPPFMNSIMPSRQSMVGSGRTFDRGSTSSCTLANNEPFELGSLTPVSPRNLIADHSRELITDHSRELITDHSRDLITDHSRDLITDHSRDLITDHSRDLITDHSRDLISDNSVVTNDSPDTTSSTLVVDDLIDLSEQTPTEKLPQMDTPPLPETEPLVPEVTSPCRQNSKIQIENISSSFKSRPVTIHQGFVATLKESFGFIETINHDKEIFFHFSNTETNVNDLDLGHEVEYTISSRIGPGGKLSAENVRVLLAGSITTPKILGEVFEGTVLRSMRSVNPDQQEYCGQVCIGKEDEKLGRHQFGITGLVNKKELLQPGDCVHFQLDEDGWAVSVKAVRTKLLATVEAVKGQYGFLNYENEEGKKLFFHQSEVKDGIILSEGDEVQFVIITNLKTGKSSACNITRLLSSSGPSQRPDRLVSRLKSLSKDTSKPRIEIIRQPKGPDGTEGFKMIREI